MQAIRVHELGSPDVMQLEEIPMPRPKEGELLIHVAAAGVNYADIGMRRGALGGPHSVSLPYTPGLEVAGTVAALGPGVTGWAEGERVMAVPDIGGYAQFALAPLERTFRIPPQVSFAAANALLVQGLTAYGVLHDAAKVRKGERVLVQAAAGGVGSLLVQLAKSAGAGLVIGTSSGGKEEFVRSLGADIAIDYTLPRWTDQIFAVTQGRGVDVVLDSVGGPSAAQAFVGLAAFGRMVMFGGTGGELLPFGDIIGPMQFKALTLSGFGGPWLRPGRALAASQALCESVARGQLRLDVEFSFPLAEAAAAHRAIESRQTRGKVVLMVE